jgi:hypothetical protein
MAGLNDPTLETGKILFIGDQGNGKTGSKAALVATGYNLLMVDTDRGFKILRSLLTDEEHYPYASYMKKKGINPADHISYQPIDVPIDFVSQSQKGISWDILSPISSSAWTKAVNLLKEWKDDEKNWGGIMDWDSNTVLDYDTMSTLAEMAKYWVQDLNGRLGSLIDEHGRDTGGAQEMIMRLMNKLTNDAVKCNIIVTGHIRRIDMSADVPQNLEARIREKKAIEPHGFPAVIGQAVGPYIGKKFNDLFIVKRDGDRRDSERRIYSVPVDNTDAKNSVWLEDSYSLETGLAEIFARLRYKEPPHDFIEHCQKFHASRRGTTPDSAASPSGFGARTGFGAAKR